MTEHYTRFIVCVPIPNKEAATIANAFHNHVVSVFGAPAESLVDGGTEFEGAFADLCRQCLIDRRVTSPDSAEGNGLTERVVRTIKFCFKKMALDKGLDYEWDELLWSLVLSYNAAKKQSTEWRISRCYLRKKQLGHLNILVGLLKLQEMLRELLKLLQLLKLLEFLQLLKLLRLLHLLKLLGLQHLLKLLGMQHLLKLLGLQHMLKLLELPRRLKLLGQLHLLKLRLAGAAGVAAAPGAAAAIEAAGAAAPAEVVGGYYPAVLVTGL
ncbi:hypothetical protein CYMTET_50077 [Cymbomonas tetramitiformis]|uniref:Integrase catalytic domain-containing protein n=1 Tax=Cymbomonas tetramitiformis TaxID=36881 RepID=A0AAE0ETV7_9CHLO|nr:hypothetical protein CYMTET_50077 [Cymbomonas tetramitiformis]